MYRFFKRFFDIFLCSLAIIVLLPLFLFAFIGVKISSKGPALYISKRIKKDHKEFNFYKFRSMHVTNKDKGLFVQDEERVFPFGRFIRKFKIDELPQLFNVIKGDMSIVGPRPMMSSSVDQLYQDKYLSVLSVKPGLTSVASLYDYIIGDEYKDNDKYVQEVLPKKLELELYYVHHRSFLYDFSLILRTIATIFLAFFGLKKKMRIKELNTINENKNKSI